MTVEHRAEVLQSYTQLATLEDGKPTIAIRCQTVNAKSFTRSSSKMEDSYLEGEEPNHM